MTIDNYIEDDWGDNSLTGRTNPEKDVYFSRTDSGTGDLLKGVYRPQWSSGGNVATSENNMARVGRSGGNPGFIQSPSVASVGRFSYDVQRISSSSSNGLSIQFLQDSKLTDGDFDVPNQYSLYAKNPTGSEYRLRKRDSDSTTNLVNATWTSDTSLHTLEATRDSFGNLEFFEDGTSKGTTTDLFIFDVNFTAIVCFDNDSGYYVDNLLIK